VVGDPLIWLAAGNQQQLVNAGQRGAQGRRAGVVRLTHLHATNGEIVNLALGAHDGNDIGREHAADQQLLNRETPKMAGRTAVAECCKFHLMQYGDYHLTKSRLSALSSDLFDVVYRSIVHL